MADNVEIKAAVTVPVATDVVTYSGDASQNVQLVKSVHVAGAEGSKTVTDMNHAEDETSGDGHGGYAALAVRKATPANTSGSDGDYEFLQMSAGRLWASATIDAALPAGTNAIGKLAANSGVDVGDVDVTSVPADPFGVNADAASATGSISAKLRFIASTGIPVTGSVTVGSHAVTNAGTFVVQDSERIADDAAFTVGASKVSPVGIQAVAHGANPDAADALDAVVPIANRHRVPFVIGGHPNVVTVKHTTITTAVTDVAMVTVAGGLKIVVTRLTITLDNASTVFPTVLIGFAATNTPTTTGVIYSHGGFPAGGGQSVGDGSGMVGVGADGEDLRITTTGNATGNGLQVMISYYTIES